MGRVVAVLFLLVASAFAANVKLYLKDGTYHVVREYSIKPDRVRFYSLERSQWEEIPLELVDVKRTSSEETQKKAALAEEARVLSEEDRVARELEEEIMRIPLNPGVYYMVGKEAKPIKQAETKVHSNKGRSVLKVLSPIPVVSGKATLEVDQERSLTVFDNPMQEFYIQLSDPQRFGILKLTPKKGVRIVENVTIIPVSKEIIEEPIEVGIYRKQLTRDGLYKIWPAKPLEAGEYAVVEYTAGKMNMQVWDFAYRSATK
jgi:hypothetical protein